MQATLTGKNVEIITITNALALTTTTAQNITLTADQIESFKKAREVQLRIINTHDQDITILIRNDGRAIAVGDPIGTNYGKTILKSGSSSVWSTWRATEFPVLGTIMDSITNVQVQCSVAPLSGSLTIKAALTW